MTFRWYGPKDSIPLEYIKQIPNMDGIVTAVYDVPVGSVWPMGSIKKIKDACAAYHLNMEVIESVPVHEDIKLGKDTRDTYINNYIETIRNLASFGVKTICYNFMPVFDWLRTDLKHYSSDGSNSLIYDHNEIMKLDPKNLSLPGWDESYTKDQLSELIESYKHVSHDQLFDNLIYFLNRITPICEQLDIKMAIHPDDPPWDLFGIPRIITNINSYKKLFEAVPSKSNGLTFCSGSLGANPNNDLIEIIRTYGDRIYFVHLRNILIPKPNSFNEVAHYSPYGSLDMYAIVNALVEVGFKLHVRPDHGRNIWGEDGKPGYGLYDRALGAAYLNGLFEAARKNKETK